ncbi:MAG: EF-P 5-aminopentanol modification-associated protein YfmH [Candidatus Limivicinus sp.]|jgi:predicted Zn-dependent peptidase
MEKTEFKDIDESLYSAVLPNGLKLCVVPKPGFSSFYAVFATKYGGNHRCFELDGRKIETPAGVAHFLEHKMFDMPNGDNALNILAANGADPNAFTASDMTAYYFQCTENFEENLRMLLRFVSTPYFTDETVEKEQGIIAQEISMGDDNPGVRIYYNLLRLLYDHHPVRDKVAGTVESISEITAQTLYDCHRAFYAPSNMCLCVEGDVDPEQILSIAEEVLPPEKRSVPLADFGADEGELPAGNYRRESMQVSAPQFLIGAKLRPAASGPDAMRQQLTGQLTMRMLVGLSSPFYMRLYAEGLLNRDFDYEVDCSYDTAAVIFGGESPEPERVLEEFNAEVKRAAEEGFDEESFELAKRASLGARLRGLEDFDNVCVSTVCGVFSGYNIFDSMAMLEKLTKEDCEAFAAEKLAEDRLAISIIDGGRV